MKDSGVVFLRDAEVLLPARARGHTGSLPETRQTHPWPRVKRTERWQIKRQRRWFHPTGVRGASGHGLLCGSPLNAARASCPSGRCLEESGAWPAFSSLAHFRGAQEASHRCLVSGRRGLGTAPPPGNPPLPTPLPGYGPGEPCVLRPLKPLVLSPGDLAECEWLTLPHPTPSRGTEQWGRTRKPLTEAEKRESVLYMVLI